MPTNIDIDEALLADVLAAGRYRTKREAVNSALREHLAMMRQREALALLGQFEFVPGWEDRSVRRAAR
jgi:Arc/MetJ family transcription regulator